MTTYERTALFAGYIKKVAQRGVELRRGYKIYERYREFTMVPGATFATNLLLCRQRAPKTGCIIECGVWRGGMSAGMADVLPGRVHLLFDSFEGLPPCKDIDGNAAAAFQRDVTSPLYFDNCRAERSFAERAMSASAAKEFHLIQGWFSDTIPTFVPPGPVAVLRLDGDWYDSTMQCLTGLYQYVMPGGLVIIDDYYFWDGCSRAVHDYFSEHKLIDRLEQLSGVAYFIKRNSA